MFERLTDRARRVVVVLAQEEARYLNHNYIGTEHLLLALIREGEGEAAKVLTSLPVSVEEAQAAVVDIIGRGEECRISHIPFTLNARKVLELALIEALQLGSNDISTAHLLLGLLRVSDDAVVYQVLRRLGQAPDDIRDRVLSNLRLAHRLAQSEPRTGPDDSETLTELLLLREVGELFQSGRQRLVTQYCLKYPTAAPAAADVIAGYFQELALPKLTRPACVSHAIDFKDLVDLAVAARLFFKKPALRKATMAFARNCMTESLGQ